MDPFTITVGALGITEFAMSSIEKLHTFIINLKDAKNVVNDIGVKLEGIKRPLDTLAAINFPDDATLKAAKEDLNKTGVAEAVNQCGTACEEFHKNLEKWTKHSNLVKMSLRDRFSVGIWNKARIKTFRTRVDSCEDIVQFAVQTTQLLIQIRSEANQEEMKKQLQSLATTVKQRMDSKNSRQEEAKKQIAELKVALANDDDETEESGQRTLALQEVEKESDILEAYQNATKEVLSQIRSKLSSQGTGNISSGNISFGAHNSGFQAGNISGGVSGLNFGKKA